MADLEKGKPGKTDKADKADKANKARQSGSSSCQKKIISTVGLKYLCI
ncbi:hypothetical protein PSHT_03858 [Puccinia striiformis]|uniref:Uncharacterized protein n=1 Tax=Puccinia striiformis TaxID=27350 RepID=A0A2S4WEG9_9BASI|nr:hypothetical protein PSHT_03858 [Puccinia striiformis]